MKHLLIVLVALTSALAFAGLQTSVYDVPGNAGTASTLAAGAGVSNLVIRTSGSGPGLTVDTNIVFKNGLFGLGTTDPQVKMDVRGKLAINTIPNIAYADLQMNGDVALTVNNMTAATRHVGLQNGDASWTQADMRFITDADGDMDFCIYTFDNGLQQNLGLYQNYLGNVGIGTNNPSSRLAVHGDAYINGSLTCSNVVDLSDAPSNTVEAIHLVSSVKSVGGKVDHAALDPRLWGTKATYVDNGRKRTNIVSATEKEPVKTNVVAVLDLVIVPDSTKRNLSMLVSACAQDAQDLRATVTNLLAQLAAQAARIEALEKR